MFKTILSFSSMLARALNERDIAECERWAIDPLSHPALQAMSARDLADLPIRHPPSATGCTTLDCC